MYLSRLPSNLAKNRYTDVLCYDHSRVLLSQTDPDDPTTDYINANYVDGYKQKNAFICTQGKDHTQFIYFPYENILVLFIAETSL
jgi:protein tyrosine phosphatase